MGHVQGRCQSGQKSDQANPIDFPSLFDSPLSHHEIDRNHRTRDRKASGCRVESRRERWGIGVQREPCYRANKTREQCPSPPGSRRRNPSGFCEGPDPKADHTEQAMATIIVRAGRALAAACDHKATMTVGSKLV